MKPVNTIRHYLKVFPTLVILLALTISGTAQDIQYRDPHNPSKGYWKLFTDAASRTTNIKFFDAQKHLLYEEVISNKYIKLTDRNINKINQAFDQITGNKMVMAKVKANFLPPTSVHPITNRIASKKANPKEANGSSRDLAPSIQVNSFVIRNTTKYYLAFKNPEQQRLYICLKDDAQQVFYSEYVNSINYTRKFDLAGLHTGKYTLVVATVNRKRKYTKQIEIGPITRTIEFEQPQSPLITSNELNN